MGVRPVGTGLDRADGHEHAQAPPHRVRVGGREREHLVEGTVAVELEQRRAHRLVHGQPGHVGGGPRRVARPARGQVGQDVGERVQQRDQHMNLGCRGARVGVPLRRAGRGEERPAQAGKRHRPREGLTGEGRVRLAQAVGALALEVALKTDELALAQVDDPLAGLVGPREGAGAPLADRLEEGIAEGMRGHARSLSPHGAVVSSGSTVKSTSVNAGGEREAPASSRSSTRKVCSPRGRRFIAIASEEPLTMGVPSMLTW